MSRAQPVSPQSPNPGPTQQGNSQTGTPLPGQSWPTPSQFDILGPLPTGTTLLQASAGTGKTFTIAALATRYVAEAGIEPDQLLLVTFGRNATRELRERVREGLVAARDALCGAQFDPQDRLLASLLADPRRDIFAQRLAGAVANFDAITIATTHGFAQQALHGLGMMSDSQAGETFLEDTAEVVSQVVDDLYVRKYSRQSGRPDISLDLALEIGSRAVADPHSQLARSVADPPVAQTRTRLAEAVRVEVAKRLRRAHAVTFDDLMSQLALALSDPVTGPAAAQRLRSRYRVVLVDEFQDTDPKQWEILQTAFHGHRTLILIGDPKQAIYAFRGADVFSYLAAGSMAGTHATLGTNYRSDAAVVEGVSQLLTGMTLGHANIVVNPVVASDMHAQSRISGLASEHRVRLRIVGNGADTPPAVSQVRIDVATDVAADIAGLLATATLTTGTGVRPLQPGDIAVLTGRNSDGQLIRDKLSQFGVPAVVNGPIRVFATPAAQAWLDLLEALEDPSPGAIRAVALSDFVGHTATELGLRGDELAEELATSLRSWAATLQTASVATMMARIESESGLAARVLSRQDGERALTDLRHIAGILHAQWRVTRAGATGLAAWLSDRMRAAQGAAKETGTELTQRLETDAQAVQVLTIHRSKGLEFPVVYVPFGWDRHKPRTAPQILRCHGQGGERVLDVRGPCPARKPNELAAAREDAGEQLRLLYVALTRGASLVVAHWAASAINTDTSPLQRILGARAEGSSDPAPSYRATRAPVDWLTGSGWVSVETVTGGSAPMPRPAARPSPDELVVAAFDRTLDTTWRRTSFTALTSSHGVAGPEYAPAGEHLDEVDPAETQAATAVSSLPVASPVELTPGPLAGMPGGAGFGTLVHGILQDLPTGRPDLDSLLGQACAAALDLTPIPGVDCAGLTAGLATALATPLGTLAGGRSLADISAADRLDELEFELPLAPGREPASLRNLAALLSGHLPPTDPLLAYPAALADLPSASERLRGYLVGAIDAVLRIRQPNGTASFVVVDYKTNRLGQRQPSGGLDLSAYHPDALATAMIGSHYPLQALLYCVALHRYLRWRLPDYDPATHMGGVMYLYLRGMLGPKAPTSTSYGVFSWQPPATLIMAISDLLDGSRS
jgi:exodeoxyribonuclease V beta subunit